MRTKKIPSALNKFLSPLMFNQQWKGPESCNKNALIPGEMPNYRIINIEIIVNK